MKAPDAPIKEFEREVERIFQALGYAVSSQVLIAGRPVDLIIQKSIEPGIRFVNNRGVPSARSKESYIRRTNGQRQRRNPGTAAGEPGIQLSQWQE